MRRRISLNQRARSPDEVLAQKWRRFCKHQLRSYLVRILTLELHTGPPTSSKSRRKPTHRHMRSRLRRRRREVIERFVRSGGAVSSLALGHNLLHGKKWPGVIGLIKSQGFEQEFIP
jgi:hypothetical protein